MVFSISQRKISGASAPLLRPRCRTNPGAAGHPQSLPVPDDLFRVVIIDNDHNTYDQVISVCIQALGVDYLHAYRIALAVDNNGEAEVARASQTEAERIAGLIRTIGIEVRVLPVTRE